MRTAVIMVASMALAACSSTAALPTTTPTVPGRAGTVTTTTAAPSAGTSTDWPTYHGDLRRTGVSASMPLAVGALTVVATLDLGAAVYASPIVVNATTIVATERNMVVGLDSTGRERWQVSLGSPASLSELPCGNIDPLGVTGTPVYDAGTKLVYLVAEHGGPPSHELVALSAIDGTVAWRTSLDLPGVDPAAMQQRGALSLTGGRVWVPFGGLAGDCGDYKGRLVGVPLAGEHTPIAYTVPTKREAGIWTAPGPTVDGAGHLLVSVGNGASGPGDPYDSSDSVLEFEGTTLVDSFAPSSWAADNAADLDLGSQGPALVGDNWVFIAGKSGTAYLLRQGRLGGIGGEVSQTEVCTSFGGTAVVDDVVYVPCSDGVRAVRISPAGTMSVVWAADPAVSGSPVVGGGRVWSLDPGAGVLHSLDPQNGASLAQVTVGVTSRFATPAISGTQLLVPTMTGLTIVRTS